ncbi:MAG: hypothetical protein QOE04_4682 [Mycobacterium sp.]|nr:hypothetical protein [Mycobacterium sp.]
MGGADEATATPRLNRLAIGSVVASAVTLFGIGSLVGIALGVVAWNSRRYEAKAVGDLPWLASRWVRSRFWSA